MYLVDIFILFILVDCGNLFLVERLFIFVGNNFEGIIWYYICMEKIVV